MGTDGIVVENVRRADNNGHAPEANLDAAVAEYTPLLRHAQRISGEHGFGDLQEMSVSYDSKIFLLRFVSNQYFLAMVLSTEGNMGRGRYELRRAELLLKNEFAL